MSADCVLNPALIRLCLSRLSVVVTGTRLLLCVLRPTMDGMSSLCCHGDGLKGWDPLTSLRSNNIITNIPVLAPRTLGPLTIDCPRLYTTTTALGSGAWADGNDGNKVANAGETISCTYQIDNTGTQTLSELCLVDDNVGLDCIDCGSADDAAVLPGGGFSCSITYEVLLTVSATCSAVQYCSRDGEDFRAVTQHDGRRSRCCGSNIARVSARGGLCRRPCTLCALISRPTPLLIGPTGPEGKGI